MTATSFISDPYFPYNGRLNAYPAWESKKAFDNGKDYLQLDLGGVHFICAVATQGNQRAEEWTKKYEISLSLNNDVWSTCKESGQTKVS